MTTSIASIRNEYSAVIRLELLVDGRSLPLAQIAPDVIVFAQPTELPPCNAVILMYVDDVERQWKVILPAGATSSRKLTATISDE